jgi:hypothetical protein
MLHSKARGLICVAEATDNGMQRVFIDGSRCMVAATHRITEATLTSDTTGADMAVGFLGSRNSREFQHQWLHR